MNNQIFSIGYRKLGTARGPTRPIWPIARTGLQIPWRHRLSKLSLLPAVAVLIGHAIWLAAIVIGRKAGDVAATDNVAAALSFQMVASVFGDVREVLSAFIQSQFYASAIALSFLGAPLIADDVHAGALDLYFARPLRRVDYILGKCLAAALVPLGLLVIPTLLLFTAAAGTAATGQSGELWHLLLPSIGGALLATFVLTGLVLGFSAQAERSRTAAALFFGALIVLTTLGNGLPQAGVSAAGYFAPDRDLRTVMDALLGARGTMFGPVVHNASAFMSFLALLGMASAGFASVWLSLRAKVSS